MTPKQLDRRAYGLYLVLGAILMEPVAYIFRDHPIVLALVIGYLFFAVVMIVLLMIMSLRDAT